MLSLPSKEAGGLSSGRAFPRGAVLSQTPACAGLTSNRATARRPRGKLVLAVQSELVGAMGVAALCVGVLASVAGQQGVRKND